MNLLSLMRMAARSSIVLKDRILTDFNLLGFYSSSTSTNRINSDRVRSNALASLAMVVIDGNF